MATSDIRQTVLSIVNQVQRRLGVTPTTTLTETKHATMLLDLLNDVIDEVSDYGDWQQMFREVAVTAQSSVGAYSVEASANIKNIHEVVWGDDVSPLEVRTIEDMRRLQRLSSFGAPRQFTIVGVSGVNPKIRVYPIPNQNAINAETSAGGVFDVAFYKKPGLLATTATAAASTVAFPARMLVQGLYAKALLEENGGEPTPQYQVAYQEYIRMRREAHNRFTADTGADNIYLTPNASRYA